MKSDRKLSQEELEFIKSVVKTTRYLSADARFELMHQLVGAVLPGSQGAFQAMVVALMLHVETKAATAMVMVADEEGDLVLSVMNAQRQPACADVLGWLAGEVLAERIARGPDVVIDKYGHTIVRPTDQD